MVEQGTTMKSFKTFRLDTANHLLWRNGDRVPVPPKNYDVLAYLVDRAGQVVTQDELLEALWPETYVNPEVLRKYILEIRKTLGDRPDKPEFIETLPKRGYRFVAPVTEENGTRPQHLPAPVVVKDEPADVIAATELVTEEKVPQETISANLVATSRSRHAWRLAAISFLAILVVATAGNYLLRSRNRTPVASPDSRSIVVLPFVDMSPGRNQDYFSDGLSEQLIHDLARVSGLKVVGRSSAFQFKNKNEDVREIASKLGVANVLEGSVRREGNRVRITAELIKAQDGFQLWSQTYDRKINDIFAVQDDIARAATDALQVKLLGTNGQPVPSTVASANPEAYEAYLQGRYFMGQGHSKEALTKALAYADEAIKLDEKYAPAWALRAAVQGRMAGFSLIDINEGSQKARDDAKRAIELDPNSAPGYLALARIQNDYDWNWEAAKISLSKAADLEPGSPDVLRHRGYIFRETGNLDEAIKLNEQAIALDPLRIDFHLGQGYAFYLAGRYREAEAELQKALELNPKAPFAHLTMGEILINMGKPQQALAEVEKEPSEWGRLTGLAWAYHALGREQESNAALNELIARHDIDSAYQIAQVYAFRGEFDKSFEWLERGYKQRDGGMTDVKIDPMLKPLQRDPRYAELLKKMRLPL
jgi:TolB-like protein/DNA-binding winged helix-turn-helix (wHTH) protein/Flp pilus assembly protein TadD